ncbi:NAD-dependent epimerase/dehydratase family protein [Jiangella asiatica]|uniref:NAD-dependent epimerase/dehydratase family protein n=1 Tax=Jiangella asiatica TaxID=2530372 RepID=A0A4R5DFV3_9ACTN|nr:NAD-dependent epimerase/dehydratase family protein [Jiangella asiatica]TDE12669.1 NAD-dependent epimerase/dehydratase family protein [Jiangella asiatica]
MSKQVIVGAGQVGSRLATLLSDEGHDVVVVSRSGSGPDGVTKVSADAGDQERLTEITRGADVIYNCANPRYHRWTQDWPPMAASLLAAAQDNGAVLAILGNLYVYGPVDGPMTEDLPLATIGVKGGVRVKMWADALAAHRAGRVRVTELRGSDYFGPGVLDQGHVGERFVPALLAGKPATYLFSPDVVRSWTYVHDVARALAVAGSDERAWGRAWHVPTAPPQSARELAERITRIAGAPRPRVRQVPRVVMEAMSLGSPMLRELRELRYQFDRPFVLDSSDFQETFGQRPTPIDEALAETIRWWRAR